MKNKYYTPTIEEFYVGFEFEREYPICNPKHKGFNTTEWHDYQIDDIEDFEFIEEDIEHKIIRVKYLDKDDIESLGWKFKWNEKSELSFTKDEIVLTFIENGSNKVFIDYNSGARLFNGTIKNKSELKKLLNQIKSNERSIKNITR